MSKFVMLVCAIMLSALAIAASAYRIDRHVASNHIKEVDQRLTNRIKELQQLNDRLIFPSLTTYHTYQLIKETMKNITNEIESAHIAVDFIVAESTNTFNETECRSYFVEFQKTAQEVVDKLAPYVGHLRMATVTKLSDAVTAAKAAQETLKDLKIRKNHCVGMECVKIFDSADYVWSTANSASFGLLCNSKKLDHGLNVTQILESEPRYDDYVREKTELANKTIACVSSRH